MKIKHILAMVVLAVAGLASCQKEEDFTLENTYHLDNLLVAKAEGFNDELYAFTVELAEEGVSGSNGNYSGTGKVISYRFYGSKYFLDTSIYSPVEAGSESDGSYVASQSTIYDVVDGKAVPVGIADGCVYVAKDNTSYRFSTTSRLKDDSEFKFVSGCTIDFPKLPKYKYLPTFIQKYEAADRTALELANGTLAMDGAAYTGQGLLFHLEFPGKFDYADGTYLVDEGYMKGFLNDIYAAWGAVWDEGSRVIEYTETGNAVSFYLTTQIIRFSTLEDGKRKVEIDCDDVVYVYEGDI